MKQVIIFIGLKLWELFKVIFYLIIGVAGLLIVCQLIYMLGSLEIFLWNLIPGVNTYDGTLWWFWRGLSFPETVGIISFLSASSIFLIMAFWDDITSDIIKFFKSNWDKAGKIANKK